MPEVWTPPAFDDISTSELVTAAYLNGLGNSLRFLKEVGRVDFQSTVNVTGTSFVNIVSLGAITYEAVPHLLEFWAFRSQAGASGTFSIHLRDGTTDLGQLHSLSATGRSDAVKLEHNFTPSAASHTYVISGINGASQTSTVLAGAGGAGTVMPGFIRITRVPT
jgi:hypothetical protein